MKLNLDLERTSLWSSLPPSPKPDLSSIYGVEEVARVFRWLNSLSEAYQSRNPKWGLIPTSPSEKDPKLEGAYFFDFKYVYDAFYGHGEWQTNEAIIRDSIILLYESTSFETCITQFFFFEKDEAIFCSLARQRERET